ncbi:hypothetical protein BT63DRAFT_457916 [Microthyrium microscopicum]|uniref:Uncharacterized protein n=1 Tax=Microthyrium microscopicum TaxID=703497 RepID=A0A6A6U7A3_9PEZI|nr:hypothetical protein BT63DRAFT_457916 [Microthyrium microscopicum]
MTKLDLFTSFDTSLIDLQNYGDDYQSFSTTESIPSERANETTLITPRASSNSLPSLQLSNQQPSNIHERLVPIMAGQLPEVINAIFETTESAATAPRRVGLFDSTSSLQGLSAPAGLDIDFIPNTLQAHTSSNEYSIVFLVLGADVSHLTRDLLLLRRLLCLSGVVSFIHLSNQPADQDTQPTETCQEIIIIAEEAGFPYFGALGYTLESSNALLSSEPTANQLCSVSILVIAA